MIKKVGDFTIKFELPPVILTGYSIVGPKDSKRPLSKYFGFVL